MAELIDLSSQDPDTLPGLAHFCEHSTLVESPTRRELMNLLFSAFPWHREISRRSRLQNLSVTTRRFFQRVYVSSTRLPSKVLPTLTLAALLRSVDETNYHFSVHPTALVGALERHSQFFVAPLFLASCTERELNAVDSEFRRNLMLDSRRLFQLGKATTSVESGAKYWKFGTGSKQTLWEEPVARGIDVRDSLLEWYEDNYSANLMKLAVISTRTLCFFLIMSSTIY